MILGDATLATALDRWALAATVDTAVLAEVESLLPPRSDLVLNSPAVTLTAQLAERFRPLAAASAAAYEPALPARSTTCRSTWPGRVGATRQRRFDPTQPPSKNGSDAVGGGPYY